MVTVYRKSECFENSVKDVTKQYDIKRSIETEATEVIIAQPHEARQVDNSEVCLKFLKPCVNDLYDIRSDEDILRFQKLGYEFNRIAAKSVYHGIARVIRKNKFSIILGTVIENPANTQFSPHDTYTTIMKRLPDDLRLDKQLETEGLQKIGGAGFLAREITRIYQDLAVQETHQQESSPYPNANTYLQALHSKLELNIGLFQQAIDVGKLDLPDNRVRNVLIEALSCYSTNFADRYRFVCRCHGDLKANNLWLRPAEEDNSATLLALDCVDFRPTFYFIDPLSDIAMLAADIQAYTMSTLAQKLIPQQSFINSQALAQQANEEVEMFLREYTQQTEAKNEKADELFAYLRPLIEYFITEKAMVCAFMWTLYDKHPLSLTKPTIGNYYFDVALFHANKLQEILRQSSKV